MIGYDEVKLRLGGIRHLLQGWLFPQLEEDIGVLDEKDRLVVEVMAMFDAAPLLAGLGWCGNGKPPYDKVAIFNALIMKAVRNLPTTKELVAVLNASGKYRALCGFKSRVPSESTFSRTFAQFTGMKLGEEGLKQIVGEKLKGAVAFHGMIDSTEIVARERPATRELESGVRCPGEREAPRLRVQAGRTLEENLADLPAECAVGCKRNSKGNIEKWTGFKAHVLCIDGDIPVAFIVTSANLHDSQAAIPLAQMAAGRVRTLYTLADAAYDAGKIEDFERSLGHVPVIDHNQRRGKPVEMPPDRTERYKARSGIERVNSHLKDAHGGNCVWVRGCEKVAFHLSLGLLVIAVEQILKLA